MIVTVDRDRFQLELWDNDKFVPNGIQPRVAKYPIALGRRGFTTPRGVWCVTNKSRTPSWRAPLWAEPEIAGNLYEFDDPINPFAGGFIALADGIGIHGTKFDPELGKRVSHGCIRMDTDDFLRIYVKILVGTSVVIL